MFDYDFIHTLQTVQLASWFSSFAHFWVAHFSQETAAADLSVCHQLRKRAPVNTLSIHSLRKTCLSPYQRSRSPTDLHSRHKTAEGAPHNRAHHHVDRGINREPQAALHRQGTNNNEAARGKPHRSAYGEKKTREALGEPVA